MRKLLVQSLCVLIVLSAVLCGCAPPQPAVERGPTHYVSFTNVEASVSEDVVNQADDKGRVEADFNLDGLMDLALMRVRPGAPDEVEILIRRPPPVSGDNAAPLVAGNVYYRAGVIRREPGTRIVGIASRVRDRFTDLVVLVAREGMRNEMIHYVNDGTGFAEAR